MSRDPERCRKWLNVGWNKRQCVKKVLRDGWCAVHHPDAVAKRRKRSEERYEEHTRILNAPFTALKAERDALKAERDRLRELLEEAADLVARLTAGSVPQSYDAKIATASAEGFGTRARTALETPR